MARLITSIFTFACLVCKALAARTAASAAAYTAQQTTQDKVQSKFHIDNDNLLFANDEIAKNFQILKSPPGVSGGKVIDPALLVKSIARHVQPSSCSWSDDTRLKGINVTKSSEGAIAWAFHTQVDWEWTPSDSPHALAGGTYDQTGHVKFSETMQAGELEFAGTLPCRTRFFDQCLNVSCGCGWDDAEAKKFGFKSRADCREAKKRCSSEYKDLGFQTPNKCYRGKASAFEAGPSSWNPLTWG